ncbi:MAG: AAA family ATPase [Blautia sp.]|nr:AAA family ATPase [Blautia sp.]
MMQIAIYGKGGIGKSTICANLSAALAIEGKKVLQIGCDPKHDSTRLLLSGKILPTVLEYLRSVPKEEARPEEILKAGFKGIGCIEAGGPKPGVGCAGRGIISPFEFLERNKVKEKYDLILYDVLGDVVCGGFAVPIRREYADAVFLVTSGEFMALYAANNILRGIRNYDGKEHKRVAGIIFNRRNVAGEEERVERFAAAVHLPICARIPRSDAFARAEEKKCTVTALEYERMQGFSAKEKGSFRGRGSQPGNQTGNQTGNQADHILDTPPSQEVYADEYRIFLKLAQEIAGGLPLCEAQPLEDEELEKVVLEEGSTGSLNLPQDGTASTGWLHTSWKTQEPLTAKWVHAAWKTQGESVSGESTETVHKLMEEAVSVEGMRIDDKLPEETASDKGMSKVDGLQEHTGAGSDFQIPLRDHGEVPAKRPPLYGCAFNGAVTTAVRLSDAIVIAHAPKACAFFTWQNITSPGRKNLFNRGILLPSAISPNFESTDLSQTEVVFGGMDRLKASVRAALDRKPGAVIVVSSCTSGIIGDDIREAENLSTPEIPVLVIPADGDIAGDYMEGIRMCLHTVAEGLIERYPEKRPGTVNIVGEVGVSNNAEVNFRWIKGLLGKMGIRINCRFLGNASAAEMRNFLAAPLNILAVDSADNTELKTWLMENYGCRFLPGALPTGFQETKEFVGRIAEFFEKEPPAEETAGPESIGTEETTESESIGTEETTGPESIGTQGEKADKRSRPQMEKPLHRLAEAALREEEKGYHKAIGELRPLLSGKKLLMTTISTNMDWLLLAAEDAGIEAVWVGVLDYLHQGIRICRSEKVQAVTQELFDIRTAEKKIEELSPDIVVANYTTAFSPGNYILDNMPMTAQAGTLSGVSVLRRWALGLAGRKEGEWLHDRKLYQKYFA